MRRRARVMTHTENPDRRDSCKAMLGSVFLSRSFLVLGNGSGQAFSDVGGNCYGQVSFTYVVDYLVHLRLGEFWSGLGSFPVLSLFFRLQASRPRVLL